jgi:exopolyphosphatase/guanosine-5'-triphosphate,3'-diphosphate pyrophosphatase
LRRACIDIGSNTTRLLVADCDHGGLIVRHEERAFTAVGRSLDPQRAIPSAKLDEVATVVAAQLATALAAGADQVLCVATAGVRRAANGRELVARVATASGGLRVRVLSEAEEARYTFVGAQSRFRDAAAGGRAVVDVGGGSTEVVIGRAPAEVQWWASVPLGSSDLEALGLRGDPPSAAELEAARAQARRVVSALAPPAARVIVAVGGSAGSLARIVGTRLDAASLARAVEILTRAPATEVALSTALHPARVRVLPAGLVILEALSELFGRPLVLGSAGLREGILLSAELPRGERRWRAG